MVQPRWLTNSGVTKARTNNGLKKRAQVHFLVRNTARFDFVFRAELSAEEAAEVVMRRREAPKGTADAAGLMRRLCAKTGVRVDFLCRVELRVEEATEVPSRR